MRGQEAALPDTILDVGEVHFQPTRTREGGCNLRKSRSDP